MNNTNSDNLFTDLSAQESANVSGGCYRGYYGGYRSSGYYRPVAYYHRPYYRPYSYRRCYGYYGGGYGYDW